MQHFNQVGSPVSFLALSLCYVCVSGMSLSSEWITLSFLCSVSLSLSHVFAVNGEDQKVVLSVSSYCGGVGWLVLCASFPYTDTHKHKHERKLTKKIMIPFITFEVFNFFHVVHALCVCIIFSCCLELSCCLIYLIYLFINLSLFFHVLLFLHGSIHAA